MDKYITILEPSSGEYSEKRSKFIAVLYPCKSEAEAGEIIAAAKTKYFDARHNAYAYILKNGSKKLSDDGEPHGTAGKPILDILQGSGIVDAVLVVTRYFGGVLLGTGGLVRAYSAAAREAVENAVRVEMCPSDVLSIECDYTYYQKLLSLAAANGGEIEATAFTDKVKLLVRVKKEHSQKFKHELTEAFSSKLVAKDEKSDFFPYFLKK